MVDKAWRAQCHWASANITTNEPHQRGIGEAVLDADVPCHRAQLTIYIKRDVDCRLAKLLFQ